MAEANRDETPLTSEEIASPPRYIWVIVWMAGRKSLAVFQLGIFQWLKKIDGFCKAHAPHREEGMPSNMLRTASHNTATEAGVAYPPGHGSTVKGHEHYGAGDPD